MWLKLKHLLIEDFSVAHTKNIKIPSPILKNALAQVTHSHRRLLQSSTITTRVIKCLSSPTWSFYCMKMRFKSKVFYLIWKSDQYLFTIDNESKLIMQIPHEWKEMETDPNVLFHFITHYWCSRVSSFFSIGCESCSREWTRRRMCVEPFLWLAFAPTAGMIESCTSFADRSIKRRAICSLFLTSCIKSIVFAEREDSDDRPVMKCALA